MPSFIRPATDHDLVALAGIDAAAKTGFVLVVSADEVTGAPLGLARVVDVEGTARLDHLSIAADHRRQGHGRALLEAVLDEAAARGAATMTLRTPADAPWAIALVADAGFVREPLPADDMRGAEMHIDLRARAGGMEMDADAFEQLVIDELDRLPDDMVDGLENVVFVVEDHPEEGEDLFGLYDGLAVTERGQYGMGELPDRIVVYRRAHLAACSDEAELRDEVHTTLVHEIAHYYGIDDAQLHELGWA